MTINGVGVLFVAIVLFGIFMSFQSFRTRLLGALKNLPTLPPMVTQRLNTLPTFVVWLLVVIAVIVVIRSLVNAVACRHEKSGGGGGRTMFETFLGADEMPPQLTQMQQLTQQVVRAADRAAQNLDEIITLVDPTCSLVKLTEDAYANSQAALSESELALSSQEQQRLRTERLTRARGQFARRRKLFGALQSGAPVLECFASPPKTATDDEAALLEAVKQLHQVLENTESRAVILSAEQMRVTLLFVQRSKDQELGPSDSSMSGGAILDSAMSPTPAVSPDALRGAALVAYANQLLVREHKINMQVSDLKQDISNLQQSIEAMKATAVRTMSGTPNIDDMRAGLTAIQAQHQQQLRA